MADDIGFYTEADAAFDRMVEASRAVFADPANPEKIQAARMAAQRYRELHNQAASSVGLPNGEERGL